MVVTQPTPLLFEPGQVAGNTVLNAYMYLVTPPSSAGMSGFGGASKVNVPGTPRPPPHSFSTYGPALVTTGGIFGPTMSTVNWHQLDQSPYTSPSQPRTRHRYVLPAVSPLYW